MDSIFRKADRESKGSFFQPLFIVVTIAANEPRRYGKNGEALINYEDTEDHLSIERTRSSVARSSAEKKRDARAVENTHRRNPGYYAKNGSAADSSSSRIWMF
jgi:hypothetical protein